jgi:hypothetical protein
MLGISHAHRRREQRQLRDHANQGALLSDAASQWQAAVTQRATANFSTEFTVADNAGQSRTDISVNAIAESKVTGLVSDLAAKEATANKDVASGYAGLDGGVKLKCSEFPSLSGDVSSSACAITLTKTLFYQTLQANAAAQTQRPTFNFINGSNMTITCADNAGQSRTDCTFTSSSTGSTALVSHYRRDELERRSLRDERQHAGSQRDHDGEAARR